MALVGVSLQRILVDWNLIARSLAGRRLSIHVQPIIAITWAASARRSFNS